MSLILIVSILIRLVALGWSIVLLRRVRDWRMAFLTVMVALMAVRQTLTLLATRDSWKVSLTAHATELPGLVVSVMAFLAIFFLERMLGERRRAEVEQARLIEELAARNAELDRFTYTVSHDLKSPLVTIKGFLGRLLQDVEAGDRESMERDAAYIDHAADTMARLLSELLELSRVGRVVNPTAEVPLGDLAAEATQLLREPIVERGVAVETDPGLPTVRGDRIRLLQVFQNVLDNAVKFMGDQPHPRVVIGARDEDGSAVCFVRDNGIGIAPEYHEQIFGLFNRLHPEIQGTGIGLALAKRIVETHGGRIWVESQGEGQGSTFCFTLPEEAVLASAIEHRKDQA